MEHFQRNYPNRTVSPFAFGVFGFGSPIQQILLIIGVHSSTAKLGRTLRQNLLLRGDGAQSTFASNTIFGVVKECDIRNDELGNQKVRQWFPS